MSYQKGLKESNARGQILYVYVCILWLKVVESCSNLSVLSLQFHLSTSDCLYVTFGVIHSFTAQKNRECTYRMCGASTKHLSIVHLFIRNVEFVGLG